MADQIAARSIRASLAQTCLARIVQHRQGTGPDRTSARATASTGWCGPSRAQRSKLRIAHEKSLKRWKREGNFALIEQANPDWSD